MATKKFYSIETLEENPKHVYDKVTSLLLKIIENIIREPQNPKYRALRVDNVLVRGNLIPAIGAMECLFEIGFKEGEECLTLPDDVPMESLKTFHAALLERRAAFLQPVPAPSQQSPPLQQPVEPVEVPLLQQMKQYSARVLQYEDPELQRQARSVVPLAHLFGAVEADMAAVRRAVKEGRLAPGQEPDACDLLLLQLLHWFKNSFFSWVDAPACVTCQRPTTFVSQILEADTRVEVYECAMCPEPTLFPRHNDAGKLLQTRRGRCGEWANCFTLLCRALGWDARLVIDLTDHVWTEVYSIGQGQWVHCDPCEDVCDRPLMYEVGWNKRLSYVLAYSYDDVQDVTWRYTTVWHEVLARRTKCSEQELLDAMLSLRAQRQAAVSPARRAFLLRRLVAELVQFLTPATASPAEHQGRMSGSLAWRLARGEARNITSYTWTVTEQQAATLRLLVGYCTVLDSYRSNCRGGLVGWQSGVSNVQQVFRKEEHDWGFVYLARTEGSKEGRVQWQFDVGDSGVVFDTVAVVYSSFTCGSGKVEWQLCSGDVCETLPPVTDLNVTCSNNFSGCKTLTLTAVLSGGDGNEAWQHAQILRQNKESTAMCPLTVDISLKRPECADSLG